MQLNDSLPRERIATTLEGVVNGEEISGAFKLGPMELLSRHFPKPSVPGMLHLIVQLPLTGEYQLYTLSCTATTYLWYVNDVYSSASVLGKRTRDDDLESVLRSKLATTSPSLVAAKD